MAGARAPARERGAEARPSSIEPAARRPPRGPAIDAGALARDLRARVRGEVRFGSGDRALYATDASNYRQVPIGVVIPEDAADVEAAVAVCRQHGAPVLARGGGTSLAGQCCNVAVVFDFTKRMNKVLAVDPERKTATVQPGVVLDALREAAERFHLTFAPDPATHSRCTIGGMIGNDSCGSHSVMAGRTADNVVELEVLTYDGARFRVGRTSEPELETILRRGDRRADVYRQLKALRDEHASEIRARYPKIPRRVSGYNLDELLPENQFDVARALVGTEGTCAIVLEATLRLVHSPPERALVLVGYPDIGTAGDEAPQVMQHEPLAVECIDETLVRDVRRKHFHSENVRLLTEGDAWLLVEIGGEDEEDLRSKVDAFVHHLDERGVATSHKTLFDHDDQARVWKIREAGVGSGFRVPGIGNMPAGWEDAAVPPEKVGRYVRDLTALANRYGYDHAYFGHVGQGCLHTRFNFRFDTPQEVQRYRSFIEDAADLVLSYGGSLSGEHGDGQARAELLPKMFGPRLVEAFRAFKRAWDPENRMNPGKIVDPNRLDEDLRWGPLYSPRQVETRFRFPDDHGLLREATERCVGIGLCRQERGGTMCPSFRVLREEKHATRGRAHLLNEMLRGDPLRGGWASTEVHEALDLCLACKGCKSDCPVNVDVATYKAEFMSHYYEKRARPKVAYALGLAHEWTRVGARAPLLANLAAAAGRGAAGIAPQREMPKIAKETFRAWYAKHGPRPHGRGSGRPRVLLWPDTFNDHYYPETLRAGLGVLGAAGFDVGIPKQDVCCGRPLYDYGFLDRAKKLLLEDVAALRSEIQAGTPLVGLEPSCVAVFRDELPNLLHGNEDAERLSKQTFTLAEVLEQAAAPPRFQMEEPLIVHGHCHQKAVMGMGAEQRILSRWGARFEIADTGCCGLAGSFGFEAAKFDLSMAIGEQVLFPLVRRADADTVLVADGFSCREQIRQGTGRHALHLAEALARGCGV